MDSNILFMFGITYSKNIKSKKKRKSDIQEESVSVCISFMQKHIKRLGLGHNELSFGKIAKRE